MKYLAVSFLFLALRLISPLSYAECFASYQAISGPNTFPWDLTVADFNNDGIDDIAAVSPNSGDPRYDGNFNIYLSRGDGTFQPVKRYVATFGAMGIAAGDFNNDGNMDLIVVANPDNDTTKEGMDIFLGNGDGTFRLGSRGGKQVRQLNAVAVGDFDRDGNLDAVVAPWSARTLGVLLGNGDGTMRGPEPIYPGSARPDDLVVADFNGDGKLDVASINAAALRRPIFIYLGNGDGTFTLKARASSHGGPFAIVAGDFNEDGVADLALANAGVAATVAVLIGNGDGTFQNATTYDVLAAFDLVAADMNGDGHADLVVHGLYGVSAILNVLIGKGDGTFMTPVQSNVPPKAWHSAIGDFNADGLPDMAFTDLVQVWFELNTGQCP